jgi:hypothetical protein
VLLRTQILTIPQLVSAELRGLDNTQAHAIRMRVERSIHGFLEQLSVNMGARSALQSLLLSLSENVRLTTMRKMLLS